MLVHMKGRLGPRETTAGAANDHVRVNVECLMELHHLTQAELAEKMRKSQPWLSKRLTGVTPFHLEDLDLVGEVFGLSPAQLLQSGYGQLDRRHSQDRRSGVDRRRMGERFGAPREPET